MRNSGCDRGTRFRNLLAGLMAGTAVIAVSAGDRVMAQSAAASEANLNIPAQPLASALIAFSRQTGVEVFVASQDAAGKRSTAVSGALRPEAALQHLLSGAGLSYSFTNPTTVTISDRIAAAHAPAADDGSLLLDTITVNGGGREGSVYSPYQTAGAAAHISGEKIERFRGSSPADMFRGTPGVMSGEARNGAGSIDPNVRGMQGFGRVATTIDGAENAVTIYQGYQGLSNRTFVDPDFIASVDVLKGADTASWGNAGSISMRTLSADDIVKPGDTWGVRVKGGVGGNTSGPVAGNKAGYRYNNPLGSVSNPTTGYGSATASPTGMDRPSLLSPTSGSGSIVGAYKGEGFDILGGYARRKQGNYHAGTHGAAANPVSTGPRPFCYANGVCNPDFLYRDVIENGGLSNYRAGEEVLNTQLETESWLFKLNADIGSDQKLQLGYTGYRSEAGDRLASAQSGYMSQALQQAQTTGTSLDTFTARYRWNPEGNDLVDMKANAYWTHLEQRNPLRGGRWGVTAESVGLPAGYRVGSDTDMWGGSISNTSLVSLDHADLNLTYGLSYRAEDTRGSRHAAALEGWVTPRDGIRQEVAGYVKGSYKPFEWDWLTLNAGLRYSHFWSKDRVDPYERSQVDNDRVVVGYETDAGGFSPSVGITVEPFEGTQVYASYSSMMRAPSIIESVSAFNSVVANNAVRPERSNNWEIGANFNRDGLMRPDDRAMLKLGYFNWNVKDYLARGIIVDPTNPNALGLDITNIHRAKFSGLELSGRYEAGGFTAELAANYFLNVEYCRTAATCEDKTLYADYATNHVQPEYTVDLTLSQKLLQDRLTIGGRISHVGPRAIGHGDVTAQGAQQFITPVRWDPYRLVDVFAEYKISGNLTASIRVENLFDQYYVDPLGLVSQPGPGRTFYASLTGTFGGDQSLNPAFSPFSGGAYGAASGVVDWTGLYAGMHAGGAFSGERGTTTALDGTTNATTRAESTDLDMKNGLFGVQAGYNWQFANGIVLGVEADWSRTWMNGKQKTVSTEAGLADAGSAQALTYHDVDWVSTIRGRLGYALGNRWMVYGTGGLALARESLAREQYWRKDSYSPVTTIASVERTKKTRLGFTLGAGTEYAINDRWSLSTSYAYSHFGSADFEFQSARAGADTTSGAFDITNGRKASNTLDLHTVNIGLNYRF
ncbi:TonB-dependent receptor domain-containing protein [Hoeflea olei]|uniref:TonB-dependent heme/hemoglobin receptor family protein n=1 Tax=Hoeflea olei TaxID=1480615 RepID=A0A1C1YXX2_9HYPH|nr:TonB-dependent receptor [Hoeflea olei]OCW58371.1 TonB-dependent heme/hemoglobin receptor family protein [Hoeflea olei]